jgi:monoamine oxidase
MTAYRLERRLPDACAITIFEAAPRLGGKILTETFDSAGIHYEAGAAELYDYSPLGSDPLRELIAELGLATLPLAGGAVFLGDRLVRGESDVGEALGVASAEALRRFRQRARSLIRPGEYYESDWRSDNADPLGGRSFQDLLNELGDPGARRYVEVSTHSDLACEPDETNAAYGLQNYLMDEPDYLRLYTIAGGIGRLTEELARDLGARIRLGCRVTAVEPARPGSYRVTARQGRDASAEEFDFVVVALPNHWLPAIQWGPAALAEAMAAHHRHYDHPAHYLRVSLLFDEPFWRTVITDSFFMLEAFGGCCVYDETSRVAGHRYGALGWLLAGDAALNYGNLDDAALIEAVLDSLPASLQAGRACYREGHVHRWLGAVNALPAGFPAREPDSRHVPDPAGHPRLLVVGDYLFDSTINGVLDSADVAVEFIAEEIHPEAQPGSPGSSAALASGLAALGLGEGPALPARAFAG